MRIRNPGWRHFRSGMEKSRIRDKDPGSATLVPILLVRVLCSDARTGGGGKMETSGDLLSPEGKLYCT
jgi:hypothetical protein